MPRPSKDWYYAGLFEDHFGRDRIVAQAHWDEPLYDSPDALRETCEAFAYDHGWKFLGLKKFCLQEV